MGESAETGGASGGSSPRKRRKLEEAEAQQPNTAGSEPPAGGSTGGDCNNGHGSDAVGALGSCVDAGTGRDGTKDVGGQLGIGLAEVGAPLGAARNDLMEMTSSVVVFRFVLCYSEIEG